MRKRIAALILFLVLLFPLTTILADTWVNGYYRKDGTYVEGHYRSDPDGDFYNNWSSRGNVNPYTGEVGTKTVPTTQYYYSNSYKPSSPSYYNNGNLTTYQPVQTPQYNSTYQPSSSGSDTGTIIVLGTILIGSFWWIIQNDRKTRVKPGN